MPDAEERAEAALALLGRRIAAQEAALAGAAWDRPLSPEAVALLALPPRELDGAELAPKHVPTLAALHERVQWMVNDLTMRQQALAVRRGRARAARRLVPARPTVDFQS